MSSIAFPLAPARRAVLADLVPAAGAKAIARDAVLVVAGAGLTGLAAQVSIHTSLSPVPFTLQTLAVLVTGAALGSVRGLLSLALYLAAGCAGVPWFANHAHGWSSMGPSAGYVVGFIAAAGVVGALAKRGADRNVLTTALLMVVGNVVLYVPGVYWLHHQVAAFSWGQAIHSGFTVFLVSDAIKLVIAALIFPAAWKLARR
ncbi:MAG TPA: biotin transporter BioY [Jatrophihabitans sp.]|jgi:biotin transport system substrate-specific component